MSRLSFFVRHVVGIAAVGVCCGAVLVAAVCAQSAGNAASVQPAIASAPPVAPDMQGWALDSQDARKALPNNSTPPARRQPTVMLPPLPKDDVGVIRRVALADNAKVAALTFDLCELDTVTTGCDMDIISFLREARIPATLFMGGKWMRTHARRVMQIMTDPQFEIANHAWSHGNFALLSPSGMRAQVLWTQAQYELLREEALAHAQAEGRPAPTIPPTPTLFRLPYGRCNDHALQTLAELGMQVVQWDVVAESGGDNTRPDYARHEALLVASRVRPGSILLFHANLVPKGSARLLRETVAELQRRGYTFVSVSALLRMGKPQRTMDGYFTTSGDNKALDARFGVDGTGRRTPFNGD